MKVKGFSDQSWKSVKVINTNPDDQKMLRPVREELFDEGFYTVAEVAHALRVYGLTGYDCRAAKELHRVAHWSADSRAQGQ